MTTLALDVPGLEGTSLPAQRLHRMLGNAVLCVSDDETVPALGCVRIEANETTISAVSTDRYTLVAETVDAETNTGPWTATVAAEDVRLIRQALSGAMRDAEERDTLTAVLRTIEDRVYLAVGGTRLDVPNLPWVFPAYERLITNARAADPQPLTQTVNPAYFGRLAKVSGPLDGPRLPRQPVTITAGGARKPILFAWGDTLSFIIMPIWLDDETPAETVDTSTGEISRPLRAVPSEP